MRLKFAIIITIFHVQFTWACSCAGLGELTKTEIDSSKAIFIGYAISVELDQSNYKRKITFKVIENLKATTEGELIYVTTNFDSGSCGVKVLEGETWYIFSNYVSPKDRTYRISICDRSARITKRKYKRSSYKELTKHMKSDQRKEVHRYKQERRFILKNYR